MNENLNTNDRYFIRVKGAEVGWVYIHTHGDFENDTYIHLWNEQIPGEVFEKALKNEYKEITQKQYYEIIDAINDDKDATPFIKEALQ